MRRFAAALALVFALPLAAQEMTPDQVWAALLKGNEVYVAGKLTYDNLKKEREELRAGQFPPVTILACADSRVPPELIFNQSLGAMFVLREAGNIADEFSIAGIEYILEDTKLLIVLGHEDCGAVTAALDPKEHSTPALRALMLRVRSSFVGIPYNLEPENVKKAVEANARASATYLLAASAPLRAAALAANPKVKIVTAYYDLDTGAVTEIK